ncbi:hypothetical protein [Wolbachia endosymbiont (group A) of Sympetrum striolatum]|uniref:hypothetical protein n=1 Tax=Wolbachia endosymbiont (group A) of Sympetrum striolatum TaxID=2954061 RepID=UPI002225C242|nr:hypothetical protein [Wolbachia endosymbiont (group A) of Sympetrum striolatum]
MGDLYNKANAPYLIAGAFATLVLLASGTLAVAHYVEFLSSVAVCCLEFIYTIYFDTRTFMQDD